MIKKSCQNCQQNKSPFGVCAKYRVAMAKHDYWDKDFIKELEKLARELARGCLDYKEK